MSPMLLCAAALAQRIAVELTEGTNLAAAVSPNGEEIVIDLQGTLWRVSIPSGSSVALTDGLGDDRQPAWSPDGRALAFQSYRDGNWHIWTVERDGTGLRQITSGHGDDREPFFNPDGAFIVFSSDRSGNYDLWAVDLHSGDLKRITSDSANDHSPASSPDGKHIAFVSAREPPGLYLLDGLDGTNRPRLLHQTRGVAAAPAWDKSGSRVSLQLLHSREGVSELLSVDFMSGETDRLSLPGEDVFPFRASWSSAQDYFYTADGVIKKARIGNDERTVQPFRAEVSLSRPFYPRRRRDFDTPEPRPVRGILHPSPSPDGRRVAFVAVGDLWVREDDGAVTRITEDHFVEIHPRWFPDGERLLFLSDRGGGGVLDLWLWDFGRAEARMISHQPGGATFPSISPEGDRVAFFGGDPRGSTGVRLKVLDLASGEARTVPWHGISPTEISWARGDHTLAVTALVPKSSRFREGHYRVLLIDTVEAGGRTLDLGLDHSLSKAVFSPGGSKLAVVADGSLYVAQIDPDSGLPEELRRVTEDPVDWPSWSGDASTLVYLSAGRLRRLELSNGWSEGLPIALTWRPERSLTRRVIHAGRLFDGFNPDYRENVDIIIEGGRIAAIEAHRSDLHDAGTIDASDQVTMPGLFEMHAHQNASSGERGGRIWLAFGITSVREPGGDAYDATERREAWASGRRTGPRAFVTGYHLDGNRVYYTTTEGTDSLAHLAYALERAQRLEYDLVKTYVRLPDLDQKRVAALAHELGIPISSHEIYPAVSYGVDAVEHLGGTSRRGYSPKITALGRSYGDVVDLLASSGMNLTPTLVLPCYFVHTSQNREIFENRQYRAFYSESGGSASLPSSLGPGGPSQIARCRSMGETVKAIVERGGRVTAGTDSPFVPYGFGLHVEIQLLEAAGLEPWQALRAATLWAAEAVGVDSDLGSIEVGKVADLILVDGDPLARVSDAMRVRATIKGGKLHTIESLLEPRPQQ